jgi:hypothetical protein
MTVTEALWLGLVVLLAIAVALAIIAVVRRQHWLAAFCAVPVGASIVLSTLGYAAGLEAWVVIATGFGFLALGTIGGNPIAALVLRFATRATTLGTHGGILVMDANSPAPIREILRGGTTIGYIERFGLIVGMLAGQPEVIAVIVAIKGLGRFSELENAAARERFIIGTLVSLAWAGCCAIAVPVP